MNPQSEIILRQKEQLKGRILFINPPNDTLLSVLDDTQNAIWTWNYADYLAFQQHGFDIHFGVEAAQHNFDQIVIFTPKSKELLSYLLHYCASHFAVNTPIFLVGEKKGGIEGAAKQLKEFGQSIKLDSARHCQFWLMNLEKTVEKNPLEKWIKTYQIQLNNKHLTICALPGVFSQAKLDVGTKVLLPYLEQVKSGKIADFGCGSGIIGCYLATLNAQNQIYALDVDAFALHSTRLTFETNQIDSNQLVILPVSNFDDAPNQLDAIVSNPPFHQGIHTNYDASEGLCREAKQHLKIKGQLWIVANRFLNYPHLIEQYFGHCQIITDQNGFKVLYASA